MKLKILFITRNYPPKVGGLENYSYNLIREFESKQPIYKITLSQHLPHLIWFLPYSLFRGFYLAKRHSIDLIHLCDGLLSPVGLLLKKAIRTETSVTIHGLDVTYGNWLYQRIIPPAISRMDKIICVSRATMGECLKRGISADKCTVIPNGIRPNQLYDKRSREELRAEFKNIMGITLQNKIVLLSVGHLVRRKGFAWFIKNVIPCLDTSYVYVLIGYGPERRHLHESIAHLNLKNRVYLLGKISDRVRNLLYNASDMFIMPNITVLGDVEGFGIAALEAGSCGLPVIASDIQGIRDAVINGKTGYLVEEGNVEGFLVRIMDMDLDREEIRAVVNSSFTWSKIYERYQRVIHHTP